MIELDAGSPMITDAATVPEAGRVLVKPIAPIGKVVLDVIMLAAGFPITTDALCVPEAGSVVVKPSSPTGRVVVVVYMRDSNSPMTADGIFVSKAGIPNWYLVASPTNRLSDVQIEPSSLVIGYHKYMVP
jgi:hypothetical protein